MKLIFWALFFMNELHLKIPGSHKLFSCKILCILFPNWILSVIKKSSFYLLRERRKTYNEFCVLCVYYRNNNFQKQRNLSADTFFIILNTSHFWEAKYIHFQKMNLPKFLLKKNSINQRKLTISNDRFSSGNLLFVNVEYYQSVSEHVMSCEYIPLELWENKVASCKLMNQQVIKLKVR